MSLLRTFFDSAPFHMGVIDDEGEDNRFIDINLAMTTHLGVGTPEEARGRTTSELKLTKSGLHIWQKHMRRSLIEGPVHFEYDRGEHHAGQWYAVTVSPVPSPNPKIQRHCFLSRDITEKRKAELALAASEERLAFALDATDEGVFDLNLTTGRLMMSPRVAEHLGLAPWEMEETIAYLNSITHPDDLAGVMAQFGEFVAGKISNFEGEYRLRHKDGHYIWFMGRAKVVKHDAAGNALRVVGTHIDITKRKEAEETLQRAKEAALDASEAKSAFLANVSHEIRTPLTSILGFADMLRESDLAPEKRQQYIDIIRQSGQHLMSLINSLLDLSKIEAGKIEADRINCTVDQVVEEVASTLRARALGKKLGFALEGTAGEAGSGEPVRLITDPTRLRQILANLLDNAIKFTPPGGRVTLRVRRQANGVGERICFDIIDTGIGITAEQQSRLFHPFVQADSSTTRQYGGTGLGLAISRRLARVLGGEIEFKATGGPGGGSCFTLWLPLEHARALTGVPSAPQAAAPPAPTLHARILLVEDSPDIQLYWGIS